MFSSCWVLSASFKSTEGEGSFRIYLEDVVLYFGIRAKVRLGEESEFLCNLCHLNNRGIGT